MMAHTASMGVAGWRGADRQSASTPAALSSTDHWASLVAGLLLIATCVFELDLAATLENVFAHKPSRASSVAQSGQASPSGTLIDLQRETVVGAYGGVPYTYPSDVIIRKPGVHDLTVKDVEWRGKPFDAPVYYGVRVQRWGGAGSTGAMVDFTHSKAISDPEQAVTSTGIMDGKPAPAEAKIKDMFKRLEASHGHNMLTANGLLRLPSLSQRLSPYVGLGGGITLPHSEVQLTSDPARTYEYQYAGPVAQVLVGVEFRLPRLSYFLEYKFSMAPYTMPLTYQDGSLLIFDIWRQFQRWLNGEAAPGGDVAMRLTSHQIIGGISVRVAH